jgi:hypothetical protein
VAWPGFRCGLPTRCVVNTSELCLPEELCEPPQEARESWVVIEQARGITADKNTVTIDQAYQQIRRHARNNNAGRRIVAEAIVVVVLQV